VKGKTMARLLGCSIVFSMLLVPSTSTRADEAEDTAVAFVEKLGGRVYSDEPGKPVTFVTLRSTKITDEGLKELGACKDLQDLSLIDTNVTNVGLKQLAVFKNLRSLNLGSTYGPQGIAKGTAEMQD
jgi:internalin A